jgi:DsbC/DsbD-like thiol-disulfide interchange protein
MIVPPAFPRQRRSGLLTCLAALCSGLITPAVAADGWVQAANSRVRLNWCGGAEGLDPKFAKDAVELAFLEMQLEPGWKTYWRSPGDSGVPPLLEWTAAKNLAKTTPYFPAPRRLPDQGGESIGYKERVIFPIGISRTNANAPVALTTNFSFGICKNICVPVEVTLTAGCFGGGMNSDIAAAVEAVPRAPGQRRESDPNLVAIAGSVAATSPKLTIDVDFGAGATDTDLFIEAPDGLYVPLSTRATPDAQGRARFIVDLTKTLDPKDLLGKALLLTMVSARGASEAIWVAK